MPTARQLLKVPRKSKKKKSVNTILQNSPQKRGSCVKLYTRSPKKPNSAVRKVARVRLSNGKIIIAYIPGESHSIPEHATVLIRGGRVPDLPGVKCKIIRGTQDAKSVSGRKQGRSLYGEKKK